MDSRELGKWGEDCAAEYLQKSGYKILMRNYRTRFGEIDLIAADKKYIVFAEVKLRKSDDFAKPREYVTAAKQAKILKTAQFWLLKNPVSLQPRFDVLEITAASSETNPKIVYLENAFEMFS